jgi:hypothetical protein
MTNQELRLLKDSVAERIHAGIVKIPPRVDPVEAERQFKFWRENDEWLGSNTVIRDPGINPDHRMSLGNSVRAQITLDKLHLPAALSGVPVGEIKERIKLFDSWFIYRG